MKTRSILFYRYLQGFLFLSLIGATSSCQKYLDAKSNQSIATPTTITDLEGMLDNFSFMNACYPSASEVASDSFYLLYSDWATLSDRQRYFYQWQKFDDIGADYDSPYQAIAYANIMLETLPKTGTAGTSRGNNVLGAASFVRASCHFALAQLFAAPYDQLTAGTDLGIALRFTSDPEQLPVRSNIMDTYNAIISDLQIAINNLPVTATMKSRPSKPAAYGMLARVYLSMRDYAHAGLYADSALQLYNKLIDYNTLSATSTTPFVRFNDEVIYDSRSSPPSALTNTKAKVDTNLYRSYTSDDLRKTVLFKINADGSAAFKGNYTGETYAAVFTGVATDELYLIKAECAVRNNDVITALSTLNTLLKNRWRTGTFQPVTASDPKLLLVQILQERNKELLFRSLRWIDLRRLNKEPAFTQTIYRNLNGMVYTLSPNGARYVFEIDQYAVHISGLVQNP